MTSSQVLELVQRFERNLSAYKSADYKEAHVRVEFIDPFFEALGWDVRNVQGRNEYDKDVVHEDAIQVQDARPRLFLPRGRGAQVLPGSQKALGIPQGRRRPGLPTAALFVERMLALHKELAAASIPADKELYARQIEATDRQIDALVYELYALSDEEIKIVEGASA